MCKVQSKENRKISRRELAEKRHLGAGAGGFPSGRTFVEVHFTCKDKIITSEHLL